MSEYGNVIHQEFGGEAAQAQVIGNDLDPEKAQRAVELGEATGIEPHVVAQNLDEFDQYHKASLGAHIVRNNQALKQYIDSHLMAAAVSGDDLGQLDKITDSVKALAEEDDPMAKMHKIFWEGFGESQEAGFIGGKIINNPNNFNEDGTLKYPIATTLALAGGQFLDLPLRAFGGALAVGEAAISGVYSDITGDESGGRRLARDMSGMVDTYMNAFMGRTPRTRQYNNAIKEQIQKVALDQRAQMYWQSGKELPVGLSKEFDAAIDRVSKEYWKKIDDLASEADKSATKERNPEFFRTFIEQHPELEGAFVRVDAEAVKRLYGEDSTNKLQSISDNEFGPMSAAIIESTVSETGIARVSITAKEAEALRSSGIKVSPENTISEVDREKILQERDRRNTKAIPSENDGLLGFIPNLDNILKVGADFGVPVRVPLVDWVTKLDKDLRDILKDDARAKLQSVSKNEGEDLKIWNQIDVWHGSPHEFEAFSTEKIGTGEGAQSYGHGLYFAENPEVAKSYAVGRQTGGTVTTPSWAGPGFPDLELLHVKPPTTYKARLHVNKEDLLDWDKPFSEQSSRVQEKLAPLLASLPEATSKYGDKSLYREIGRRLNLKDFGKEGKGSFDEQASKALKEAGIPGLKYLDQGSRKTADISRLEAQIEKYKAEGSDYDDLEKQLAEAKAVDKPTSNFVIFDDSKIQIIERNGEAIRSVRQSSGLEPQSEILDNIKDERKYGAEKLKLARLDAKAREDLDINMGSKDAFDITDDKGNVVGTLQGQLNGTEYFVDWISSRGWAQSFGPKQLMQLIKELKAEYPEIKTITGDRVSGARGGTEKQGERVTFKAQVNPEAPSGWDIIEGEPIEGKWHEFAHIRGGETLEGLIKPKELWTENEHKIRDVVNKVIDKIGPKGQKRGVVSSIRHGGSTSSGVFITFDQTEALVLVSLTSKDPINTAAHEAGHALKKSGAFSENEWDILTERALKGDGDKGTWLDQYKIKQRYGDTDKATQIEEAIMHKFGDYVSGKWMPEAGPIREMFERLKEIVTQIRLGLKEAFGRELTAEDIFEKARTGGYKGRRPLTSKAEYVFKPNDAEVKAARREYTPEEQKRIADAKEWDRLEQKEADKEELTPEEVKKLDDFRIGANREPTADDKAATDHYNRTIGEIKSQRESQPELPGVTRIEDQQIFEKAAAAGLPVKQYRKLLQAIEDSREADRKYQLEKAEAYERKKQTKEWKTEAEALEPKVTEELNALPDYRANEFFRTGVLDGEKLSKMPKLNPEAIDPELVRGLPERYLSDKGMHPDDAAGLLGIESGSSLVEMLSSWKEAQGEVPAAKFVNDLVKGEVERRMSVKHGPLSENIIDEARGHVINNAQYELIHQDLLAAALRAGKSELPISKKDMEAYAKDEFLRAPNGNVSTEEILREMGKSQRLATLALLDGDPVASLKHMERRMMSFIAAREAKKFETQKRIAERNFKRFSEREVPNFPQEYTNFIHDIMMKLGAGKLNFTFEDWQKRVAAEQHQSLWDFTAYKMNHDGLELKFDDRMFDDSLRDQTNRPPIDNISVQEYLNAADFVKSMIKNGRDEYRLDRAGQEQDRIAIKQSIVDQISTLDPMEFTDAKGGSKMFKVIPEKLSSIIRTIGAAHWQLESIINRIDRGNAFGPFTQNVMRPLVEGANYVGVLERKYAAKLNTLKDGANLKEKIPNNLFIEPTTLELDPGQQRFMPMTRENLRKILLYWGSESGQKKLSEGYNVEPQKIQAWLDKHATKEDYEWAKSLGSIWRDLKDEIDVMYQNVSGAPAEDIKLAKLTSPHGDYDGWYHPLVPHPNVEMTRVGGAPDYATGLMQKNFFRSTTANGHVMRRTGAVYALDLGLDSTASVMKRQIYDLAMRPGLIEASKFLKDRQIRTAITRHMGKEITDLIDPYLEDVANASNNNDAAANMALRIWNGFRSNVIGTMIGFNPGTVLKHGPTALVQSITEVGGKDFANAARNLWGINERTGERNWTFAMDTSEELQRRHQNYLETLKGQNAQVLGKTTFREKMLSLGAYPVAISDLLSAVPTWLAQYNRSMGEGLTHGDATYMADRAVRRAHGSTAVTNRPSVMRGGFGMSILNPVYGFFSHILNRQYEMAWRASDLVKGANRGEITPKEFAATSGALAIMLTSYIIAPAIIEELVSPLPSKPEDGWGKRAAKTIGFSLSSSWIGLRDIAHFAVGGYNPSIGVTGPVTQGVRDIINDVSNFGKSTSEENVGKTVKHAFVAAGMATGLTNAQMGRWAQLAYEYAIEKDVPDGYWQWLVALRFGQTKGHSKSPEEYVEHLTGEH